MKNEYLQLTLLSIFTLILTVRYTVSLAKGVKPVLLLKREKSLKEKTVEAQPPGTGLSGAILSEGLGGDG